MNTSIALDEMNLPFNRTGTFGADFCENLHVALGDIEEKVSRCFFQTQCTSMTVHL